MITAPTTTPTTIYFQSSLASSPISVGPVDGTLPREVVDEVTVVALLALLVGYVGVLVGSNPFLISLILTPRAASNSDLERFTACSRASTGITPSRAITDGNRM